MTPENFSEGNTPRTGTQSAGTYDPTSATSRGTGSTMQQAGRVADEATGQAREQAGEMAAEAKDKARGLAGQAKQQVTTQLAGQKDRATDQLGSITRALRQTSDNLRDQEQGAVAGYLEEAAGQVERLSSYLRNRTVGDLLTEAENFARREPALFLGGAVLLGLFGARFLKSSSPDRGYYASRIYEEGYGARPYAGRSYENGPYRGRSYDEPRYREPYASPETAFSSRTTGAGNASSSAGRTTGGSTGTGVGSTGTGTSVGTTPGTGTTAARGASGTSTTSETTSGDTTRTASPEGRRNA